MLDSRAECSTVIVSPRTSNDRHIAPSSDGSDPEDSLVATARLVDRDHLDPRPIGSISVEDFLESANQTSWIRTLVAPVAEPEPSA